MPWRTHENVDNSESYPHTLMTENRKMIFCSRNLHVYELQKRTTAPGLLFNDRGGTDYLLQIFGHVVCGFALESGKRTCMNLRVSRNNTASPRAE